MLGLESTCHEMSKDLETITAEHDKLENLYLAVLIKCEAAESTLATYQARKIGTRKKPCPAYGRQERLILSSNNTGYSAQQWQTVFSFLLANVERFFRVSRIAIDSVGK